MKLYLPSIQPKSSINKLFLHAREDFFCLLITFANSLDPGFENIQHPKRKIWHNINKVRRNNKIQKLMMIKIHFFANHLSQ